MEEQVLDKLVYHLAQLNFEECFTLLEGSHDDPLQNALLMMVSFDMFYYSMDYVREKDSQREEMLRIIDEIVQPEFLQQGDQVFDQLFLCLRTRQQAIGLYLELIRTDTLSDRAIAQCRMLLDTLNRVQDYTLAPYQEAFQQELTVLLKLLEAQVALSNFNYLSTLICLKEAHLQLQNWEDVFVNKKYTPLLHNKSSEGNVVHKWLQNYKQTLIGKASLYFDNFLCGIRPKEGPLSSSKIDMQCVTLKVNYFALLLNLADAKIRKMWEEQGYRCHSESDTVEGAQGESDLQKVYFPSWQTEGVPPEVETRLTYMVTQEVSVSHKPIVRKDREMDWDFYAAKVDTHMFAVLAHVHKKVHSETSKIREFFTMVCSALSRTTPAAIKQS